jgi:hypothetical protein
MPSPKSGDLVIRGSTEVGFVVLDALNYKLLGGPLREFQDALSMATVLCQNLGAIWHEPLDNRGRALSDAYILKSSSDGHRPAGSATPPTPAQRSKRDSDAS